MCARSSSASAARSGRSLMLTWAAVALFAFGAACSGSSSTDEAAPTELAAESPVAGAVVATATESVTVSPAATAVGAEASATPTTEATAAPTEPAPLGISSPVFADGGDIPIRYSCDGADLLPPLAFSNIPPEAMTLAVVINDPDAPGGTWIHWVQFNIEVVDEVAEGASSMAEVGDVGTAGVNSFGILGYGGPCPPSGTHRYFFKLFALDVELGLAEGATKGALTAAMEGHVLASAELLGRYTRQ